MRKHESLINDFQQFLIKYALENNLTTNEKLQSLLIKALLTTVETYQCEDHQNNFIVEAHRVYDDKLIYQSTINYIMELLNRINFSEIPNSNLQLKHWLLGASCVALKNIYHFDVGYNPENNFFALSISSKKTASILTLLNKCELTLLKSINYDIPTFPPFTQPPLATKNASDENISMGAAPICTPKP